MILYWQFPFLGIFDSTFTVNPLAWQIKRILIECSTLRWSLKYVFFGIIVFCLKLGMFQNIYLLAELPPNPHLGWWNDTRFNQDFERTINSLFEFSSFSDYRTSKKIVVIALGHEIQERFKLLNILYISIKNSWMMPWIILYLKD